MCLCRVHIDKMGLILGKAMDENFKKNQEFMLASQRAQVIYTCFACMQFVAIFSMYYCCRLHCSMQWSQHLKISLLH